jgi:hypothetical protein
VFSDDDRRAFTPTVDPRSRCDVGADRGKRDDFRANVVTSNGETLASRPSMQRSPLAFTVALVALAPLACSSANFDTASNDTGATDGGGDTFSGSDTTDGTKGCVVPPAATGSETDFCNAVADVYSRCGNCEPCRQANANNCIQFGDGISEGYKKAFVACKDTLTCGDFAAWGGDPCILAQLQSATWSAKQNAVRDKYCSMCTAQKFECDHFFDFGASGDAGPDAGQDTLGAFVALGNDTTAQNILDHCFASAIDCNPIAFALCTAGAFCDPMPHDACGSKFCNK